jgi:hypothetical protein
MRILALAQARRSQVPVRVGRSRSAVSASLSAAALEPPGCDSAELPRDAVRVGLRSVRRTSRSNQARRRAHAHGPQRGFNDGGATDAVRNDLADIDAALGWLATRGQWNSAAEIALLAGGCWTSGTQAGGSLRWFETIEPHIEDPALKAVLLATGGFVAIGAGEPVVTRRWERDALDIAHDDGGAPYAVALAGCIRAAPLILTGPEEAANTCSTPPPQRPEWTTSPADLSRCGSTWRRYVSQRSMCRPHRTHIPTTSATPEPSRGRRLASSEH